MTLDLALVGCGGMGLFHIHGLRELTELGAPPLRLAAVCDPVAERAEHVARAAEEALGHRPRVWSDFESMLDRQRLDAVDIVTDPATHHVLAGQAFDAGLHVLVEKPLGITVRAARAMIDASLRSGMTLSVAENFRRDPVNRMAKAVLDAGVIGEPRVVIQTSLLGGDTISTGVPWRHRKLEGGFPLELGVHYADLLLHHIGDIDEVFAYAGIYEPVRRPPTSIPEFYRHRSASEAEMIEATAEDTVFGVLRFAGGALGQWSLSGAAHGKPWRGRDVFGALGRLEVPVERTGAPIVVSIDGQETHAGPEALELVPEFELDEVTTRLFGAKCTEYSMSSNLLNAKLVAIELHDFARAVLDEREPEVGGEEGLRAIAVAYALCESAQSGGPVSVRDVESGEVWAYQAEIDVRIGLA